MELGYYKLISALPTLLTVLWLIGYLILSWKGERIRRFIALFAFSNILKAKTNGSAAAKGWLFKKVFLGNGDEDEVLRETVFFSFGLFAVFNTLFLSVFFMFYHLLLLDVSCTCDQDDKTKECFNVEPENTGLELYSIEPINCSSAAVQMEVWMWCARRLFSMLAWP